MPMDMDILFFEQCIKELQTLFHETDDKEKFANTLSDFNKKMNKMNLSEKKKLPAFISAHHACELIYKINEKTFILEYGG